jgi:hypothetical protein
VEFAEHHAPELIAVHADQEVQTEEVHIVEVLAVKNVQSQNLIRRLFRYDA